MRKIIAIEIEHPDCSTSSFREKLHRVISDEFRTEIYDTWDTTDDRPRAGAEVEVEARRPSYS